MKQITQNFLEGESPTLRFIVIKKLILYRTKYIYRNGYLGGC